MYVVVPTTAVLETPQYGRQKSQGLKLHLPTAQCVSDNTSHCLALVTSNVLSTVNNTAANVTGTCIQYYMHYAFVY